MKETLVQSGKSKTVLGLDLISIAHWFADEAKAAFLAQNEIEIADQVKNLWVPDNMLNGNCQRMSFKIYPLPFPSIEALRKIWPLKDEREISIHIREGKAVFSVDCFGFVNWVRITDVPELYDDLLKHYDFNDADEPKAVFND